MEEESTTAFDYLQFEAGGSSQTGETETAVRSSVIKVESQGEDTIPSDGDNWTEDEVEPLANIAARDETVVSKPTKSKSSLIKVPRVRKEERIPKIKVPKPPKIKAPKKEKVVKPVFVDCEVCGKSVQRRKFKLHMMVHNGEKPHLCDTCGKSFTWKFALVTHKRVHSGEKPYLCKHCGQSFRSSSRFAEHSTIHTGRRSYVCEHCALAFRTSGRLKRHLRIHTGEKPYKCSFCERGFSESYNLKQHLRLHTGEKPPHVCSICTHAFIRRKMLVDHLRIHHGILAPAAHMLMIKSDTGADEMTEGSRMTQDSKLSEEHIIPHAPSVININITFD